MHLVQYPLTNQHVAEFQETNADLEMEQEIVMLMNDLSTLSPNIANSYHENENETLSTFLG